jgi:hypothetical protein
VATPKRPAAKRPPRHATPTAKAVRAQLAELEQRVAGIKDTARAALALAMAKRIDDPETSASAAASCGRVLADAIEQLQALAPPAAETKPIDELRARRAKHRARASAT